MYAIVDIETTGGQPNANGITEICILLHNGHKVTDVYTTLINPQKPIPLYLQAFTGITQQMVEDAPVFGDIADKIFELLKDKIFVAHNVNFDYNFVKQQLHNAGYGINLKRICTIRLSRKLFPGLKSYSLGNLCASLQLTLNNRHRAEGDARATALLFNKILENNGQVVIAEMLQKGSKEQQLPPNVSREDFDKLPKTAGIYYFIDNTGKALYVGKAKNIKSRVSSHFSGKLTTRQKQNFLRDIYGLSYLQTGNELLASIIESHEIKRLWPDENRSQKKVTQTYALYDYPDQNGKIRLGIDKLRKDIKPLVAFSNYTSALSYLNSLVQEYDLCPKLCNLQQINTPCRNEQLNICSGNCLSPNETDFYNSKINEFISQLLAQTKIYYIAGNGRNNTEQSIIIYEPGMFVGYCFLSVKDPIDFDSIKDLATSLKLNDTIEAILNKVIEERDNGYKIYTQFKMAMV